MSFYLSWDVEKYREEHESEEQWLLRKAFMERWKSDYSEERLACLTSLFFNIEFMGCKYPEEVMQEVARLSQDRSVNVYELSSYRQFINNKEITDDKLIVSDNDMFTQDIDEKAFAIDKPEKCYAMLPLKKTKTQIKKCIIKKKKKKKNLLQDMSTPVKCEKASRMMRLMGWTGGGLGLRGDGIIEPIIPSLYNVNGKGFGHVAENPKTSSKTVLATQIPKPKNKRIKLQHLAKMVSEEDILNTLLVHDHGQTTETPQFTPFCHVLEQPDPTKLVKTERVNCRTDFLNTILELIKRETPVTRIIFPIQLCKKDRRCYQFIIRNANSRSRITLSPTEDLIVSQIEQIMASEPGLTLEMALTEEPKAPSKKQGGGMKRKMKKKEKDSVMTKMKVELSINQSKDSVVETKSENISPETDLPLTESTEKLAEINERIKTEQIQRRKKKLTARLSLRNQFKRFFCDSLLDFMRSKYTLTEISFIDKLTRNFQYFVKTVCACVNNRTVAPFATLKVVCEEILAHTNGCVLDAQFDPNRKRSVFVRKLYCKKPIQLNEGKDPAYSKILNKDIIVDNFDQPDDQNRETVETVHNSYKATNGENEDVIIIDRGMMQGIIDSLTSHYKSLEEANTNLHNLHNREITNDSNPEKNTNNDFKYAKSFKPYDQLDIPRKITKNSRNWYELSDLFLKRDVEEQISASNFDNRNKENNVELVQDINQKEGTNIFLMEDKNGQDLKRVGVNEVCNNDEVMLDNNEHSEHRAIQSTSDIEVNINNKGELGKINNFRTGELKKSHNPIEINSDFNMTPVKTVHNNHLKDAIENNSNCFSESNNETSKTCHDIVLIESHILNVEGIYKKIQNIVENIGDKNGFLPLFKYHGVIDNGAVYSCHNKDTCLWLKYVLSDYKVIDYKSVIKIHKVKINVMSFNRDAKKLFELLEIYNKGLKCTNWKTVFEQYNHYLFIIIVEMDNVSFQYICDNNFSLFIGHGIAQFSIGI